MKLLDKISVAVGVNLFIYFLLLMLAPFGVTFFGPDMFTDWGAIFFLVMVFIEISFLMM